MSSVFPEMDTGDWIIGFKRFRPVVSESKAVKRKKIQGKNRGRRTLAERVESIFEFIDMQPEPFPKSEFQKIGLNPTTAESWVRLIEYIQNQPMIKVTQMGSSTYIERLENRYLSMLRKRVLNPSLSMKERTQTMEDYIGALITLEKIEDGRIKK
ncbi:MAG: hypothetical protein ACFFED_06340 [Candidatus Thorarchaeota archaeon]